MRTLTGLACGICALAAAGCASPTGSSQADATAQQVASLQSRIERLEADAALLRAQIAAARKSTEDPIALQDALNRKAREYPQDPHADGPPRAINLPFSYPR